MVSHLVDTCDSMDSYIPYNGEYRPAKHGSAGAAAALGDGCSRAQSSPDTALHCQVLLATSAPPASQLFPLPQWAVSSGLTAAYHKWYSGVTQLLAALGLTWSHVADAPPAIPHHDDLMVQYGRGRAAHERAVRDRMACIDVFERWQRLNTAFYWHLRPSLLLAGPDQLTDTRWIDTLFEGRVADGRTLCRWAVDKVRYDDRDSQINLLRGLTTSSLKSTATCAQLKAHALEMQEVWLLLQTSAPAAPGGLSDLYDFLVSCIPAAPVTSHLTTVRTWLAGQVAQYKVGANPEFTSYTKALASMVSYARTIGLPPGDTKAGAAVVIDALGNVSFSASSGGGGSLLALRGHERRIPTKPSDAPGNNCSKCDSWWCDALARASSADDCKNHCVCAPDSSFDAEKCSKGGSYISSRRTYWAANPNLTTLKGIRLKVNEDGTVTESTSGSDGKGGGKGRGRGGGRGRGRGRFLMVTNPEPAPDAQGVSIADIATHSRPVESDDGLSQLPGESFDQWLERHECSSSCAGGLSMIGTKFARGRGRGRGTVVGANTLPVTQLPHSSVVFNVGNLTVIDDDEVPSHYYRFDSEDHELDRALALSIQDKLRLESNAETLEQLKLDRAIAESLSHELNRPSETSTQKPIGALLMMASSSSDNGLGTVTEGDDGGETDGDDESINDIEQPPADDSPTEDALRASMHALREAQAALTQRELQLQQLASSSENMVERQKQDADLIARLQMQVKSQHQVQNTPGAMGSVLGTPSTRSPYDKQHSLLSPTCNPALVSVDAMRASTPSGHGAGGASVKNPTPTQSPMPSLFTIGGDKDKKDTRTINEDLAHAMLLNERQLRLAKTKDSRGTLLKIMSDTLSTVMVGVTHGASHFSRQQWAYIIILSQVIRPWAQPMLQLLWERFINVLKIMAIKLLDKGKSVACNIMLSSVSRLLELRSLISTRMHATPTPSAFGTTDQYYCVGYCGISYYCNRC